MNDLAARGPWAVMWGERGLSIGALWDDTARRISVGDVVPIPATLMDEYGLAGREIATLRDQLRAAQSRMTSAREAMTHFVKGFDDGLVGELDSWLNHPHTPIGRMTPGLARSAKLDREKVATHKSSGHN